MILVKEKDGWELYYSPGSLHKKAFVFHRLCNRVMWGGWRCTYCISLIPKKLLSKRTVLQSLDKI